MKQNILELAGDFKPIGTDILRGLKGGNIPALTQAQLEKLFDYSGLGGFNSDQSKRFTDQIQKMEQTDFGAGMLGAMLTTGGAPIKLTEQIPTQANPNLGNEAAGSYFPTINTLWLNPGTIDVTVNSSLQSAALLDTIAHELYHSYQTNILGKLLGVFDPNSVKRELDADLAGAKILYEYDVKFNTSYYNQYYVQEHYSGTYWQLGDNNGGLYGLSNITSPGVTNDFGAIFDQVVRYDHFNLDNYNYLISNFLHSFETPNNSYNSLSAAGISDTDDINQSAINRLLFYRPSLLPNAPTSYGTIHSYNDVTNYIQSVLNYYYKKDVNNGNGFGNNATITTSWHYSQLLGVFQNASGDTMGALQIPPQVMQILVDISIESPMEITQQQFLALGAAMQNGVNLPESTVGILSPPTLPPWVDPSSSSANQQGLNGWYYDSQSNSWISTIGSYPITVGGGSGYNFGSQDPSIIGGGGVSIWYNPTTDHTQAIASGQQPSAGYTTLVKSDDAGITKAYNNAYDYNNNLPLVAREAAANAAALAYQNAEHNGLSVAQANANASIAAQQAALNTLLYYGYDVDDLGDDDDLDDDLDDIFDIDDDDILDDTTGTVAVSGSGNSGGGTGGSGGGSTGGGGSSGGGSSSGDDGSYDRDEDDPVDTSYDTSYDDPGDGGDPSGGDYNGGGDSVGTIYIDFNSYDNELEQGITVANWW
ncbi:hypothetical protein [Mucilaginibacter paludis]|uniref:Uncharacterized protein n=1 Tax=Mucilaginibacter paludis DSM 18603 TaxID=714943 RepID=H1YHY7_9SPHI|nr:hypothetical protein [Mucilaginibacter paludis]EHQ25535.1 hypothetical protein Mucpa_1375 [Mucilaginibacter paludis DSM 18603]